MEKWQFQPLAKYPIRFAQVLWFGPSPIEGQEPHVNNGTLSLLDLGGKRVGVTCHHVLSKCRERLETEPGLLCYIGRQLVPDLLSRILHEDPLADLAVLDLTSFDLAEATTDEEIGSSFFSGPPRPTQDIEEGDFVCFGGYPGEFRQVVRFNELVFPTFSSGACRVEAVLQDRLICQLSREYMLTIIDRCEFAGTWDLGGLSGSPAFVWGEPHLEFAGIVFEFSVDAMNEVDYGLVHIRPSWFLAKSDIMAIER